MLITLLALVASWTIDALAGPVETLRLDVATTEQLASLDHVDPNLASRIVAYRQERGGHLSTVEELRAVEGMTPAALQDLRARTGTVLSVGGDTGRRYQSVEEVLARYDSEPSIQQVQSWTSEYARTNPEMLQAWARASQSFALLPRLQVETLINDNLDRRFAYESVAGDLLARQTAMDETQGIRFLVRSQWDLSELVMSSDRIRVINESQDAVKLRDRLLSQVTKLYFDRRRQQVQLLLDPPYDLQARVDATLRLLELTAGIDALTGGRFSREMKPARP
jgi:hypothetical protein